MGSGLLSCQPRGRTSLHTQFWPLMMSNYWNSTTGCRGLLMDSCSAAGGGRCVCRQVMSVLWGQSTASLGTLGQTHRAEPAPIPSKGISPCSYTQQGLHPGATTPALQQGIASALGKTRTANCHLTGQLWTDCLVVEKGAASSGLPCCKGQSRRVSCPENLPIPAPAVPLLNTGHFSPAPGGRITSPSHRK